MYCFWTAAMFAWEEENDGGKVARARARTRTMEGRQSEISTTMSRRGWRCCRRQNPGLDAMTRWKKRKHQVRLVCSQGGR